MIAGRYELVRVVAYGGMSAVYEARHTVSKRRVALKVMEADPRETSSTRSRFLREASAPAEIGHPGIVEVYDGGTDIDGALFLAMEYLEGDSLRDRLASGTISQRRGVEMVLRVLDPLVAAHEKGFVHRDLKPENVMILKGPDGARTADKLKLLDFGIARRIGAEGPTRTNTGMGTPCYMSPEQATSARDVGAASDVWAVGVMLYEVLAGELPFFGETAHAVILEACTRPHRPLLSLVPTAPPALAAVVERCLHKNPNERYPDARALKDAIEASLIGVSLEDDPVVDPRTLADDDLVPSDPAPANAHASTDLAAGSLPNTSESHEVTLSFESARETPVSPANQKAGLGELRTNEVVQPLRTQNVKSLHGDRKVAAKLPTRVIPRGDQQNDEVSLAPSIQPGVAAVASSRRVVVAAGVVAAAVIIVAIVVRQSDQQTASASTDAQPTSAPARYAGASIGQPVEIAPAAPIPEVQATTVLAVAIPPQSPTVEPEGSRTSTSHRDKRPSAVSANNEAQHAQSDESPTDPERINRARACMRLGNVECVRREIGSNPTSAPEISILIDALVMRGEYGQAARWARNYVRRYPSDARTADYTSLIERFAARTQ